MKKSFYILYICLAALIVACKPTPDNDVDLSGLRITHSELTFSYKETSFPITIMSDTPWSLESDSDWLSATKTASENGEDLFIEASPNSTEADRQGTIIVTNSNGFKTINVLQKKDNRDFCDIYLTVEPVSNSKLNGAKLVIPYRRGSAANIPLITVGVAGKAKGSVVVDSLKNITLEEGEGTIELNVKGRTGEAGTLLFTVSGLPYTVYGEGTQCCIDVQAGEPVLSKTIPQIRSMFSDEEVEITQNLAFFGTVVSSSIENGFEANKFAICDGNIPGSGILVVCNNAHSLIQGDYCRIFLKGSKLKSVNGVKAIVLEDDDDVDVLEKGHLVEPILLSGVSISPYESMLCSIEQVQIHDSELSKSTFSGNTVMSKYGFPASFNMYVLPSATFASKNLTSGSGVITGIIGTNELSEYAIIPLHTYSVSGLTGMRYNMSAIFKTDVSRITDLPAEGQTGISFNLTSNITWSLSCNSDWIYNLTPTSGNGSDAAQQISFSVAENTRARRTAQITITGQGVPSITLNIIQKEGNTILDEDFSGVLTEFGTSTKVFPQSAGVDYGNNMSAIGLGDWYATHCYLSATPDLSYGILRVGKTLTKGYITTPKLTALGDAPTNIEINFLGGMYTASKDTWIGVELIGPGEIQASSSVDYITKHSDTYPASKIETLPCYVVKGMSTTQLVRSSVRINGATKDTQLKLTATYKGGASGADCLLFMVGDFHADYVD